MPESFLLDWDARSFTPKRHFDLYRDRIWEVFTQVDLQPDRGVNFKAKVVHEEHSNASVTTVLSSAHLVRRTRSCIAQSNNIDFYIGYQVAGYSLTCQHNCSKVLKTGNFAFYDYTEPFEIDLRGAGLTGMQVLRLRRTPVLEANQMRLFDLEGTFATHRLMPLLHMHLALAAQASCPAELEFHCHSAEEITYLLLDNPALGHSARSEKLWCRILREVEGNLADRNFGIAQLAQSLQVSPRYVQKLFAVHGATFSDILREKRLSAAAARLQECPRHASIEDIAYACGFGDLSTFYRNFKSRYGLNPGNIRQDSLPAQRLPRPE